MIHFAYDGSINGNWTAHYALRLAAQDAERRLRLLHVRVPDTTDEAVTDALAHLRLRAERLHVDMALQHLAPARNVSAALLDQVPAGPDQLLVAGTRVREKTRGYLAGTVSEQLLRARHCTVVALRVVQPGLLGLPHRLLLPLRGSASSLHAPLPFLRRWVPQLSALTLLRVRAMARWRFRALSAEAGMRLLEPERAALHEQEAWLQETLGLRHTRMEALALLSDDVPKEIVIAANRGKTQLILMGASRQNLRERFVWGNPIEQVLRNAPCDVAISSSPAP